MQSLSKAELDVLLLLFPHVFQNFQEMQFAVYQLVVFLLLIVSDVGTAIYNRLHEVDDRVSTSALFPNLFLCIKCDLIFFVTS